MKSSFEDAAQCYQDASVGQLAVLVAHLSTTVTK